MGATAEEGISSLSRDLAQELHGRIVSGAVPLGSWLRQDAIAEEFGVSRTPVREALQLLHGQGVVEVVPHRGAVVRGPTPRDIRENCEVRAELEGLAAELAATRIRDGQLKSLLECRRHVEEFPSTVIASPRTERARRRLATEWARTNEALHATVLAAADNHQLTESIRDLSTRLPRNLTFQVLWGDSHLVMRNTSEHVAIIDAIAARDARQARIAAREHLLNAGELLSRWYENEIWGRERAR